MRNINDEIAPALQQDILWEKIPGVTHTMGYRNMLHVLSLRKKPCKCVIATVTSQRDDSMLAEEIIREASLPAATGIGGVLPLVMSALAAGVWLAVAYTLSFVGVVSVDEASLELCAWREWSSLAVW